MAYKRNAHAIKVAVVIKNGCTVTARSFIPKRPEKLGGDSEAESFADLA